MKNVLNAVLHATELFVLAVIGISVASIPLGIALFATSLIPASKFIDDIRGNEIKGSIFSVTRNGFIHENTFARPFKFISLITCKDKQQKFAEEALNMFVEMKAKDKNNKPKKYNTYSQALTLSLLKRLERNGYIENLEYKKSGVSRLIIEKIFFGNFKDLFKNRKYPMYDITFNLTDKERKKEDLMELAFGKKETRNSAAVPSSTMNNNKTDTGVETSSAVFTQANTNDHNNTSIVESKGQETPSRKAELLDMKAELLAAKEMQPVNNSSDNSKRNKK